MRVHAAEAHSVRSLPPGLVLGRHVVVDRIGAGGMAELYLARIDGPPRFHKAVALKLLHPHLADDPELVRMFEKEARIAALLDHPNIVQVLDVDRAGPEHFLVLEYVHGRDLRRVLASDERPPLGAALRVVVEIARALHYVHSRTDGDGRPLGLVHRDVSPANILVAFHGAVKLADFGVAKIAEQTVKTSAGTLKGKFGYMSPEQYLQESIDARTDVFALGVVLYESTTGRRPFYGDRPVSIMNRALAGRYPAPTEIVPGYPPALAAIVARALAVEVDDRFADMAEFAAAIEGFAADHALDLGGDGLAGHLRRLFGSPPMPSLDVPATRSATSMPRLGAPEGITDSSVSRSPDGTRRLRTATLTALVGAVVGAGSFAAWSARSDDRLERTQSPETTEGPVQTADIAARPAHVEPAVTPAPVPVEPAGTPAPVPVEPAGTPAPVPVEPAVVIAPRSDKHGAAPAKRRAPPRTREPVERTTTSAPALDARPRDGMFPRGLK